MEQHDDPLGLNLMPGARHYRAYVGPSDNYDLVCAMVFNLLTCLGLRQHHRVLDIGCGSLRNGRVLIPYLNPGCYFGVEPNAWLVEEGIEHEVGASLVEIKKPSIFHADSLDGVKENLSIDYAFAQSVFSHSGMSILDGWLAQVSRHLRSTGIFLATFLPGEQDYAGDDWVYPQCVRFTEKTMKRLAEKNGLRFERINWLHPRQSWAAFTKEHFDRTLLDNGISWNTFVQQYMSRY